MDDVRFLSSITAVLKTSLFLLWTWSPIVMTQFFFADSSCQGSRTFVLTNTLTVVFIYSVKGWSWCESVSSQCCCILHSSVMCFCALQTYTFGFLWFIKRCYWQFCWFNCYLGIIGYLDNTNVGKMFSKKKKIQYWFMYFDASVRLC